MAQDISHAEIIDALGGVRAVADATGKSYNAVHNWRNIPARGIPDDFKVRAAIARLAAERGVALPAGEFPVTADAASTAREPDPAALTAILDQLGGHAVIAEGSGIPVTDLEAMQAQGRIWNHHRAALIAFAREFGGADLDADRLTLRPLGKDSPSWREAS